MLSLIQFEKIPDGKVFATGVLPNSYEGEGLNMVGGHQGELLRWIAKKGYGHDWAIYCHWSNYSVEWIEENGDKVSSKDNIQKCVPCDKEVLNLYRL